MVQKFALKFAPFLVSHEPSDKKKSSSLPRDSKSAKWGVAGNKMAGKSKKEKDRKPTEDRESKPAVGLTLDEVVKRAGCYNIELPEIVLTTGESEKSPNN